MHTHELMSDNKVIMEWLHRLGVKFHTSFLVINSEIESQPIVYANEAFFKMIGYSEEETLGRNGRFLHGEKTSQKASENIHACIASGETGIFEIVNYRKNGTPFWNELSIQPLTFPEKNLKFTLLLQRDITERKRTEAMIKLQKQTYKKIESGHKLSSILQNICHTCELFFIDGAKCTVLLIDNEERIYTIGATQSMPKGFEEAIIGLKVEGDIGTCGAAFYRGQPVIVEDMTTDYLWRHHQHLVKKYRLASSWSIPISNVEDVTIGTFGIYFPAPVTPDDKDLKFMEGVASIVSLAIKYSLQHEEILKLAYSDGDTDLPNRNYFRNEIDKLLKKGKEGFVAFISTDEYTKVVDQYGHRAGDALMYEIGKRLIVQQNSSENLIARFSDSTLSLYSITPFVKIPEYLEQLMRGFADPIKVGDMELFLTLKIGVAIVMPHQQDSEELIRCSDSALSQAKLRTGEAICYFESELDEFLMRDLRVANELTAALNRNEIGVHLQPKVDLETGEVLSFEALARWTSPDLGVIPPDIFIPAAEKNGKIRLLEKSILKQVLEWMKKRVDQGLKLRQVAINISADHFFHHSFVPNLLDMTTEYGIEPKWIRLEITERIGFVDIETANKVFKHLKYCGFTASIDDFGTGYSSLSYLQKLPIEELKIDRSFITNMDEPGTLAIIQTIIQLANNLNMHAVAEGVETDKERKILLRLGCKEGQGYLFYKPMPLNEAFLL
ncbi:MAG: EAL domain-containing protein [Planococcus sp. (in: firmicutes)]|uniref:bifunctional diguanylate cyclase/phosphodiesterase n=1 Tax=Planococcus halocryophilus TaxID=1215089 RepID=UPI001F0D1543|nr:EAL domain-containing protein [Planococcus halocryophilus]MCH4826875.1 EAL domain-containing protein [Planococcus halocryophilus]